jgi:N-acetylglucosaminyldiphosphoundecaprenol N-acetyl-beta-D-mannosaminyltransferase
MKTLLAVELFNCPIHSIDMERTLEYIGECIDTGHPIHHVVVIAAKLVNMQKDPLLYDSVVNCDIINADGQAVVWAAGFLGKHLPGRVAGIDLMQDLVKMAAVRGYRIFFFGAKEEVVSAVVSKYTNRYGSELIAGYRNGYYTREEEPAIARQIGESGADILFVAITSPKKEIFLNAYKDLIRVPFIMGVGGSFDVVSGKTKRAPLWMQRSGLEWLFRIYQEPRRMWKRYAITNTLFLILFFKQWARQGFRREAANY